MILLKDTFKINRTKSLLSILISEYFSTEILGTFYLYQLSEKFVPRTNELTKPSPFLDHRETERWNQGECAPSFTQNPSISAGGVPAGTVSVPETGIA